MKEKGNFKILFRYLKKHKFLTIIYTFFTIVKYFESLVNAFIWAFAFEALTNGNQSEFILYLALWSGIIIFCWVCIQVPTDLIYNVLEKDFVEDISKDLYKKINDLPAIAHEEIGVGEFVNRLTSDPDQILDLLKQLIRLSCRFIIAAIITCVSFAISWVVGIELVVLCVVMYVISNIFYPKIKKTHEGIKKKSDEYIKIVTQNITGIREIKSLGIKKNINQQTDDLLFDLFKRQRKIGVSESFYYGINNLVYFVIQFIILLTLGIQVFDNVITIGSFLIIEKYIWRIDEVVETLSEFGVAYNKVSVSLKRIDEILNNKLYEDEKFGNKVINDEKVSIEFKNVKFKYREEEKLILKGLNLKVEPGKKIAVVGKSGQGKSTIFNLLLRYFDSTKGSIKLNGIDIKDLTEESLRDNISIIRQTPFLFNASIIDNFRIVKPNVKLKEIRRVCKLAYIDDYIMSLPNKYNTVIGEGGINLSGGQKQRIAIARTLLKNTKIILFDEATSALDNTSQEYIKKTIDNLVKTHTVIIVAHRLSTIMDADEITVIDGGKALATGTHKELMSKCKLYKELYCPEVLDF